jgi:CD109 antigen
MGMAEEDEDGLHWSTGGGIRSPEPMPGSQSADIEATAYATLALTKHGDAFNASRAAKWLVSRRNAYGGFGSTQDTVVALQALTEYATGGRADVDLKVGINAGGDEKTLRITGNNYDVLQVIEVPIDEEIEITVDGKGEAIAQVVRRFNIPEPEKTEKILKVSVDYDATEVEVDDIVTVSVELEFAPPIPVEAGMIVLDISVPTGFSPVTESIAAAVDRVEKIKRYDIAGRKVIFYIENMAPGDRIRFTFDVKAMYPVKAKGVSSQAYSYYQPEIRGETLSGDITVR